MTQGKHLMTHETFAIPDADTCWDAVRESDSAYDGQFICAVITTGIYCRPSCKARTPKRKNVRFFATIDQAREHGFRACKRCHPDNLLSGTQDDHTRMIEQVCQHIQERITQGTSAPTLTDLGRITGYSPTHLQRTFKEHMGISPKAYASEQRRAYFRQQLRTQERITDAIYSAGYGSTSRAYEKNGDHLGMTPTDYQRGGEAMTITYALTESPLGMLLVARTERGICRLLLADTEDEAEKRLYQEFHQADVVRDDVGLGADLDAVLAYLQGWQPTLDLPLDMRVTAFQARVLAELQRIPYGETRSYADIARAIGNPKAARAVGNACNKNPVPVIVPCHRVVHSDGRITGYAYGVERKRYLLDLEEEHAESTQDA
jgi:AraC family transcriptional regulator of adaptative response/methylated-DNA-[protein]-cysteine methyltransferase